MFNKLKTINELIKNNKFLRFLLIQISIIIVLVFIFVFTHCSFVNLMPSCSWKETYGFYCPSCGSTRCVISFANGDFLSSFRYNPFTFILIIYLFLLDLLYIINTVFNKKYFKFFYPKWWYVIIYFSLWAIYTIIINMFNVNSL